MIIVPGNRAPFAHNSLMREDFCPRFGCQGLAFDLFHSRQIRYGWVWDPVLFTRHIVGALPVSRRSAVIARQEWLANSEVGTRA